MAEFKVEIGATNKELNEKLKQSSENIKNFSSKADKELNSIGKASNTASKGIGNLKKSTISGTYAMTAFSRTVQDAPFGIMGVSNNITNLTEQFGYLKAKTGSAKGALQAMLKDLKGFGGISLGISLLTSALLVFGDKIFATKDKAKALKEEQDKLTESLDNYKNSLESVEKARLTGAQKAQKELLDLRLLKTIVEDNTRSIDDREAALKKLRDLYPNYLKNLSDEKILNGGLATVYDKVTTSIIKRAKATAATNQIVKNSEDLLNLESQLAAEKSNLIKLEDAYNKAVKTSTGNARTGVNTTLDRTKKAVEAQKELLNGLQSQIQNLELTNIDLEQAIDVTASINLSNINVDPIDEKNKERIAKTIASEFQNVVSLEDYIFDKDLSIGDIAAGKIGEFAGGVKDQWLTQVEPLNQFIKDNPLEIIDVNRFDEQAVKFKERLALFQQETQALLNFGIENGLGTFAEGIGNAIGNGTNALEVAGASMLGVLGDIMVKYGKLSVAFGIASEALKKAFENPFGGGIGAIVGGLALIAIGSAIKSYSSSVASGNGSGSSGSSRGSSIGTNAGGSERQTSFSSYGSSSSFNSGSGNVVFEIQGTKLVGVLNKTLRKNKSLSGTLSLS